MSSQTNGEEEEEEEDSLFLENVLDQLYDFGNGPASKRKINSQKKNKRKREEEKEDEEEDVEFPTVCSDSEEESSGGADNVSAKQQQTKTEQTDPSSKQRSRVEVVTFQDPRKKPRTNLRPATDKLPTPQTTEQKEEGQLEDLNLEKARLEVHRFGITGYKKEQQRTFEQDRAVMLGARPPKKDYVNYKKLQQEVKDKKQKAREEVQPELRKKKKKPSNPRDKRKASSSSSSGSKGPSGSSGQVGRFKNGMLILSSKEIQKIKGNKKRR